MKHLYFVRHGQSEANKISMWSGSHDTPLAPEGHAQAKKTADLIRKQGLSFDVIISSPLQRAHHTAKYIAEAAGYPADKIELHPGFQERHFGELEGTVNPEATEKYYLDEAHLDTYKDVERLVDLQWRAQQMLDYLHTLPQDTILVVSHGNFARALRRAINKEPLNERGKRIENAELVKMI